MKKTILAIWLAALAIVGIISSGCTTGGSANKLVDSANKLGNSADKKEFTVKAFRFGYSPDVLEVSKGDLVKINIQNTDTTHGMRIPDLALRGNNSLEFRAEKEGEFAWYCNVMCGEGHREMKGKLVVR